MKHKRDNPPIRRASQALRARFAVLVPRKALARQVRASRLVSPAFARQPVRPVQKKRISGRRRSRPRELFPHRPWHVTDLFRKRQEHRRLSMGQELPKAMWTDGLLTLETYPSFGASGKLVSLVKGAGTLPARRVSVGATRKGSVPTRFTCRKNGAVTARPSASF